MVSPVRAFGKYLLDEEIARGGMSRVFSARLRGVGGFEKRLVVKQVLPELARDPRFVAMFVNEAKTLVQMSHPHIAPVFELGVADGVYFLAMEYVEGATLAAILADGPLAPGHVAHLGAQICDALHYAHTRFDVVHRDVTPRNVIVDGDGHARLLDFGIATPLSDEDAPIFGTPGYLSPEQIAGRAGPASDVFSLGAVLFEALTGRRAFDARTVEEAERALTTEGPAFTPEDGVDEALAAIVLRALSREADDRFRSARELGRALRGWLASAHPEGVAPELGLRAERAEARAEERERISNEPSDDATTPASREVRTLATSPALAALIADDGVEEGTVPLERAGKRPAERDAAPRRSVAAWSAGAVLIAAITVAFAWPHDPPAETAPARAPEPAPRVAAPVPDPPPEPPAEPAPEVAEPPAPQVAPPPRATLLTVNASPWAELELDGRSLGRTPQRRIPVRAGRHTIVLRCPPLGREVRHSFDAEAGRPLVLVADMTVDPPVVRRR